MGVDVARRFFPQSLFDFFDFFPHCLLGSFVDYSSRTACSVVGVFVIHGISNIVAGFPCGFRLQGFAKYGVYFSLLVFCVVLS